MLRSGVRIFLYEDRLLHAKHVSVDGDLATIGSSNVDIRSFTLNAEANLIHYAPYQVRRLNTLQVRYFSGSRELLAIDCARRSLHRTLDETLTLLISQLLSFERFPAHNARHTAAQGKSGAVRA